MKGLLYIVFDFLDFFVDTYAVKLAKFDVLKFLLCVYFSCTRALFYFYIILLTIKQKILDVLKNDGIPLNICFLVMEEKVPVLQLGFNKWHD